MIIADILKLTTEIITNNQISIENISEIRGNSSLKEFIYITSEIMILHKTGFLDPIYKKKDEAKFSKTCQRRICSKST